MELNETIKQHFKDFSNHIKKLREDREITILELSKRTGIRKEYLRKIEEGTAYGARIEKHIAKIADAFEINLYEIFQY